MSVLCPPDLTQSGSGAPWQPAYPVNQKGVALQVCLGASAPALPVLAILAPLWGTNEALVLGPPFSSDLSAL